MFGTIDAWLMFKLCGEHVTDPSNASRTMLYDIAAGAWDQELLALLDIPERALPRVVPSAGTLGSTRSDALHGHAVRSQASPATSKRRSSVRPAWTRVWARTRTAPARSCC